MSIHCCPG